MPDNVSNKVLRLSKNQVGRDFVVGDIHGNFNLLDIFFTKVHFNESCDRLLSVGDVIDRGPESERALHYLSKPWFYSVCGNHEVMLIGAQDRVCGMYELWMHNGGEWSEAISDELLDQMADVFRDLPYIIEVETEGGKVGLVHADMPVKKTWDQTVSALEKGKLKDKEMQVFLWSRDTYRKLCMSLEYPGAVREFSIEGIHRIYVGHSIVKTPALFGNFMFIDTGAYTSGNLSVVDLSNEGVIMIQTANSE